jgi:endogenous inhibitor of DNA gyrase (YacG/DUF329 family)
MPAQMAGQKEHEDMEAVYGAGPTGKRYVTNRFEAVSCQACGRKVKRKSWQQKFCSDRCRDFAKGQNRVRKSFLGDETREAPNPPKSASKNNSLQAAKTGSSVPLNLLGGYRWPNAPQLDARTLANVIHREIGGLS